MEHLPNLNAAFIKLRLIFPLWHLSLLLLLLIQFYHNKIRKDPSSTTSLTKRAYSLPETPSSRISQPCLRSISHGTTFTWVILTRQDSCIKYGWRRIKRQFPPAREMTSSYPFEELITSALNQALRVPRKDLKTTFLFFIFQKEILQTSPRCWSQGWPGPFQPAVFACLKQYSQCKANSTRHTLTNVNEQRDTTTS